MKKQEPPTGQSPELKAKNKKQIAKEMGIHPNTFSRRLKNAGLCVPRGVISPRQQQEILRRLRWGEKV